MCVRPHAYMYTLFFFWLCPSSCGILPHQGSEPGTWQWNRGVLTTGPPGNSHMYTLFLKKIYYLFYFIYFWLRWVFVAACALSLDAARGGYSSLQCAGFSLRWLLLLRSTGSRRMGFSRCGTWAQ